MLRSIFKIISLISLSILTGCKQDVKLKDIQGYSYKTKKFGKAIWMLENLKVKEDRFGNRIKYFIPNNDSINIQNFGLLYDYETACNVCPKGWRIPTNQEWEDMFEFNKNNNAGNYKDREYWKNNENSNSSMLSARPAGYGNNGSHFNKFSTSAIFWSKTKENEHFVWAFILEEGNDSIRKVSQHPTYAFSIRCVKNLP